MPHRFTHGPAIALLVVPGAFAQPVVTRTGVSSPAYFTDHQPSITADGGIVAATVAGARDGLTRACWFPAAPGVCCDPVILPPLPGIGHDDWTAAATGITSDGRYIVGTWQEFPEAGAPTFPVRWDRQTGEAISLVSNPAFSFNFPTGVSADGSVVVGYVVTERDVFSGVIQARAFVWTPDVGARFLDALIEDEPFSIASAVSPDGATIVGLSAGYAVRWSPAGDVTRLASDPSRPETAYAYSHATAISADGATIAGSYFLGDAFANGSAFQWKTTNPIMRLIPSDTACWFGDLYATRVHAISADGGVMVGAVGYPGPDVMYWTAHTGMIPLGRTLNLLGRLGVNALGEPTRVVMSADGRTLLISDWFDDPELIIARNVEPPDVRPWRSWPTLPRVVCGTPASVELESDALGVQCFSYRWHHLAPGASTPVALVDGWTPEGIGMRVEGADTAYLILTPPRPGRYFCRFEGMSGFTDGQPVLVRTCAADFNIDGQVGLGDIFAFLTAYFAGERQAAINCHPGPPTVQDVFDFLAAYFTGCA